MYQNAQFKKVYSGIASIVLQVAHRGKEIPLKQFASKIAPLLIDYQANKSNPELRRPVELYSKALETALTQFRKLPECYQFAAIEEDLVRKRPIARKLRWFYSAKHLKNLLLFKMVSLCSGI